MAVLLPWWAELSNISYYKHTQDFAFWAVYNQEFLIENAPIKILNGVNKQVARQEGKSVNGIANELAVELIENGFNMVEVSNSTNKYPHTFVYIGSGDVDETLEVLRVFVDIAEVKTGNMNYGEGITVVLGNDYIK